MDVLKEDTIEMEVEIEGDTKALDTCDRLWLYLGPWEPTGESLVHIMLPDRRTNNPINLRGEVMGRGHPIPQGDRHRNDAIEHSGARITWHIGGWGSLQMWRQAGLCVCSR